MPEKPLIVDLDGTLLQSDFFVESFFSFISKFPHKVLLLLMWLLKGKAYLKQQLALSADIDVTSLPYNRRLIQWLETQKSQGRMLVLATATHRLTAAQIATHLGIFDDVIATEGNINLKGAIKRDGLVRRYGMRGFDYVGNSADDLTVWAAADRAYMVNASLRVEALAKAQGNAESLMQTQYYLRDWLSAMRIHQWAKNLLILVPLLAAHQLGQYIPNAIVTFLLFGLCASSVYLLNDILDLQSDRKNSTRSGRHFAAGTLPIEKGFFLAFILLTIAFSVASLCLPWKFTIVLIIYYVLTLGYSLGLKRFLALDVIGLAVFYTLRIIAGTFIFEGKLTFWLLAFSMFIFLSLAFVKRYTELYAMLKQGDISKTQGRSYYTDDIAVVTSLGTAAGYLAVMVLTLYIQDPATILLYHHPKVIWFSCPVLLFWITRVWLLAHRGEIHEDPVVFALRDKCSLLVGVIFGCIFWLAI